MRQQPPPKRDDPYDLSGLRVALYCRVSLDKTKEEKSTKDQKKIGLEWAASVGAQVVDVFEDVSLSASSFAKKDRPGFDELVQLVSSGGVDLVWLWDQNRLARRTRVVGDFVELCRGQGVRWVVKTQIRDPADPTDTMFSAILGAIDEAYSNRLSVDVKRGQASSAADGRPAGRVPYGYTRAYDDRTRKFIRQEPDIWDGDGNGDAREASPAWVVREIFARVAAGQSVYSITKDLHARGIPSPTGKRWWDATGVKRIARNPLYIARRVYQGKVLELDQGVTTWPALVDEETFWACQRVLSDPARRGTRPGRVRYLLSYVVRCAACDAPLQGTRNNGHPAYSCFRFNCLRTSIRQEPLDDYVEEVVIRWLSDPAVFTELTQANDSAAAAQARADAEQLRAELDEWRRMAEAGEIGPAGYAAAERGLLKRIGEAEEHAQALVLPPVLVGNLGPAAAARWADLDLSTRKQIVRAVADISVRRVGKGSYRGVTVADRVEWRWLLGPDAEPGPRRLNATPVVAAWPSMAEVVAACPPEGWPSTSAAAATLGVQPHKARTLLWQAQRAGLLEAVEGAGRTSAHRWHVAGSGSHDPAAAPDPGREARREAAAGLRRQGLSYNAIARALGVSAGTAYADVQKHGAGQG